MTPRRLTFCLCLVATSLVLAASGSRLAGQINIPYAAGQNIQPVYEGWERNPDGSFNMWFGYLNRNYVEEPNVPVGPDNVFSPGDADRGQPTHFYQRRNEFVFSVKVPADWGTRDLVWTVTRDGKPDKAIGTLALVWEVDKAMMVKNMNGQDDLVNVERDKEPTLTVGPVPGSVTLPATVRLTATVTDDGLPPPPIPSAGNASRGRGARGSLSINAPQYPPAPHFLRTGLSIGWLHYRGPGKVTFNPDGFVATTGGKATTTTASFSEPGTYVLRAVASDSWLVVAHDVTVVVK